jgi:transcription antitermination factor NusG
VLQGWSLGQDLDGGERVRVVQGPFRGFEAIFERYLSGAERIAILLNAIDSKGLRVVLPASAVTVSHNQGNHQGQNLSRRLCRVT